MYPSWSDERLKVHLLWVDTSVSVGPSLKGDWTKLVNLGVVNSPECTHHGVMNSSRCAHFGVMPTLVWAHFRVVTGRSVLTLEW